MYTLAVSDVAASAASEAAATCDLRATRAELVQSLERQATPLAALCVSFRNVVHDMKFPMAPALSTIVASGVLDATELVHTASAVPAAAGLFLSWLTSPVTDGLCADAKPLGADVHDRRCDVPPPSLLTKTVSLSNKLQTPEQSLFWSPTFASGAYPGGGARLPCVFRSPGRARH